MATIYQYFHIGKTQVGRGVLIEPAHISNSCLCSRHTANPQHRAGGCAPDRQRARTAAESEESCSTNPTVDMVHSDQSMLVGTHWLEHAWQVHDR